MIRTERHSRYQNTLPKGQFAKILVNRHKHPILGRGQAHDTAIVRPRFDILNEDHIVAKGTRDVSKAERDTLVEKQAHRAGSAVNDFLVGAIIGSEGLGCANVVPAQTRVIGDDVLDRYPGAQLAQNELDGDASSPNHRFAVHHVWIDGDALVHGHCLVVRC